MLNILYVCECVVWLLLWSYTTHEIVVYFQPINCFYHSLLWFYPYCISDEVNHQWQTLAKKKSARQIITKSEPNFIHQFGICGDEHPVCTHYVRLLAERNMIRKMNYAFITLTFWMCCMLHTINYSTWKWEACVAFWCFLIAKHCLIKSIETPIMTSAHGEN